MIKRLLFLLLFPLALFSCVSEREVDCTGSFRLSLRFTHNIQGADRLSDEIRSIRVYIFDAHTGILEDIVLVGESDIARGYKVVEGINQGLYNIIAWGGSSANMFQGGYSDAPITIGTTTLNDFRMMLANSPLSGNPTAEVAPTVSNFDNLFHAIAQNVPVVFNTQQTVDLSFIKNTSTLRITVTGIENLRSTMPVNLFTTGRNWLYRYNNTPVANTPRMLFLPQSETLTANNTVEVSIRQQRLHVNQSAADRVMLYVQNPATGDNIIPPLDLIAAIMQNPAYQTQSAIDRQDLFEITIAIPPPANGDVNFYVTITINGWEVVILDAVPV